MSFGRMANQFLLYVLKDDLRCALLILVVTAMEAVYVLEQPSTSLLMLHERFVWLVETLGNLGIKVPSCVDILSPPEDTVMVFLCVFFPAYGSTTNTCVVVVWECHCFGLRGSNDCFLTLGSRSAIEHIFKWHFLQQLRCFTNTFGCELFNTLHPRDPFYFPTVAG